jgi:hypothetical protein
MTYAEAVKRIERWKRRYDISEEPEAQDEWSQNWREDDKALAVLRRAEPLLDAAMNLEMMEYCPDNSDSLTALMKAALAYWEAK